MSCPQHRQRLATVGGAGGLSKSRHVGAAASPGFDRVGARFLNLSHSISVGIGRRDGYGNNLERVA